MISAQLPVLLGSGPALVSAALEPHQCSTIRLRLHDPRSTSEEDQDVRHRPLPWLLSGQLLRAELNPAAEMLHAATPSSKF